MASTRPGCVRAGSPGVGQAADLSVAQADEHQGEELASGGHAGDVAVVAPLGNAVVVGLRNEPPRWRLTASMAAQRTRRDPCFVIGPRRTVVSDSRWRGVRPAKQQSLSAAGERPTSPISATNTAPNTAPPPAALARRGSPPRRPAERRHRARADRGRATHAVPGLPSCAHFEAEEDALAYGWCRAHDQFVKLYHPPGCLVVPVPVQGAGEGAHHLHLSAAAGCPLRCPVRVRRRARPMCCRRRRPPSSRRPPLP